MAQSIRERSTQPKRIPSQLHLSHLHRFQSLHFPSAGMTHAPVRSCSFPLPLTARERVSPASSGAVTFIPAGKITLVTTWRGLQLLSFGRAEEEGGEATRDLLSCTACLAARSCMACFAVHLWFLFWVGLLFCFFFFTSQTNCFLMYVGYVCLFVL